MHDEVVEFILDSISGLSSSYFFTFDVERCTDGRKRDLWQHPRSIVTFYPNGERWIDFLSNFSVFRDER